MRYNNDTNIVQPNENETVFAPKVVGGRDYNLLKLLAKKMNFKFEYIEPMERTQGAINSDYPDNLTFSGGLGILQRRVRGQLHLPKKSNKITMFKEADLLLGDITITWERIKAVEFSFFTLADSGAFATHAPKRLNEALALVRPFRWEVWPLLLFTIVISGPAFYVLIAIPSMWETSISKTLTMFNLRNGRNKMRTTTKMVSEQLKKMKKQKFIYSMKYINEMNYCVRNNCSSLNIRRLYKSKPKFKKNYCIHETGSSINLFGKCIWFVITLFLRQCKNLSLFGFEHKN